VPDLRLIGSLEKEIEREKMLLEQEEQQLNQLTKNAAREESSRKAQKKKVKPTLHSDFSEIEMHVLLKENVSSQDHVGMLNLESPPLASGYDVAADGEIASVVKDLASHLTSLNSNLKEMEEVRAWVNRAEESLGEVLRRLEGIEDVDRIYGAELV